MHYTLPLKQVIIYFIQILMNIYYSNITTTIIYRNGFKRPCLSTMMSMMKRDANRTLNSIIPRLSVLVGMLYITSMTGPVIAAQDKPVWATKIEKQSPPGKLEKLNASGKDFFAILTEQVTRYPKGYILILHGIRQNPDWAFVIKPLRQNLPRYGWSTLSAQLPEPGEKATKKDYTKLLEQSTAYILAAQGLLKEKKAGRIVLIGYGLGAQMAVDWLSKTPDPAIDALILISMADDNKDSGLDSNADLLKIKAPVLDIIGELDPARIKRAARERMQKSNEQEQEQYRQLEITGANQNYSHQGDELVKRIRGWLNKTLKIKKPQ